MPSPILLLGLAAVLAPLSAAHTIFTTLFVNDVSQGDGTCIRMPHNGGTCTFPIAGLDSPDMACGKDGQNAVAFSCPVPAGAKLTFEFRAWADKSNPGAIDASHKGSAAIYLKAVANMSDGAAAGAAGDGWFKLWAEGYDEAAQLWATDKLIANNGLLSVALPPAGLADGYYLLRTEILTLQNVTNNAVSPQVFVGCAQLFVQGSSSASASTSSEIPTVAIPGHLHASDPGLTLNIYQQPLKLPYIVAGPPAWIPPTTKSANIKQQNTASSTPSDAVPASCLLKNGNWCGYELPAYTTETGCWDSAANCWAQADACYKSAPPSGYGGCVAWSKRKCQVVADACSARAFVGPPAQGQKIVTGDPDVDGGVDAGVAKIPAAVNAANAGDAVQQTVSASTTAAAVEASPGPAVVVVEPGSASASVSDGCQQPQRRRTRRRL
ncbi:glycosyl hydrolase family 61-domain-containing protein [Lasiosphaeria miniovina]|uniref:lytic cellulose monooxygenase (C4-dehydrogenating) n=1 Tax=Lasiosphaeria miniovina TaxID=1954250 RepID=A0AA40ALK2_9PEZI|nr:glycosyl hydrolase family 61-domain-containing protein [Lasiosphaeria miniovina]KAK0718082.1 glycosyl hydrolase family 61-domain-containing protein [Lasiosphaeria miniovina]